MYRQIWLHADDQHFQSILWRASSELQVEVYWLLTVITTSYYVRSRYLHIFS